MRLTRFRVPEVAGVAVAVLRDDVLFEVAESWVDALRQSVGLSPGGLTETGRSRPVADCELLAPLPDDGRGVICTGMNYLQHDAEARGLLQTAPSDYPVFFLKLGASMADPFADLPLDPSISAEFDWEIELGVVIGKAGRHIHRDEVSDYVAGYTIVNDITARDLQRQHVQWFIGKNVSASSPIGPWVTTLDEIGFPPDIQLSLTVNGIEKQSAKTTDMLFDVPTLISTASRTVALRPGDVFATGTPAGVGFARHPAEFLRPGDVVEAQIEGVGSIRSTVIAGNDGSGPGRAGRPEWP
ncbi:MAG: fumarylacetoacetate hydrolase family protein [Acidimicrobiales bacterium]|jgi:2-keto-4-pentenoate hydratase/2-oxohepta-3-ene-1,7-dioic acid hydratase in catechol pathway